MTDQRLEKLTRPPIIEVICGVFFQELGGLDPVLAGTYWGERREDYPGRELHHAAGAPPLMVGRGVGPLRTWFISPGDGSFVLQIQSNRFYLNWRRRGGTYPRFSSPAGLLAKTLDEFSRFAEFCGRELGKQPAVEAVELGKIDHLVEGEDWADKEDLGRLIPTLEATVTATSTPAPDMALRFREERDGHTLQVALTTATVPEAEADQRVVRLETTVVRPVSPASELKPAFEAANEEANGVFATLVPDRTRFT